MVLTHTIESESKKKLSIKHVQWIDFHSNRILLFRNNMCGINFGKIESVHHLNLKWVCTVCSYEKCLNENNYPENVGIWKIPHDIWCPNESIIKKTNISKAILFTESECSVLFYVDLTFKFTRFRICLWK